MYIDPEFRCLANLGLDKKRLVTETNNLNVVAEKHAWKNQFGVFRNAIDTENNNNVIGKWKSKITWKTSF